VANCSGVSAREPYPGLPVMDGPRSPACPPAQLLAPPPALAGRALSDAGRLAARAAPIQ